MGIFNNIKLAFHSLWQNKTRSILTIIVLMVMSFVIMFLFQFALSFLSSVNNSYDNVVKDSNDVLSISKQEKHTQNGYTTYNIVEIHQEDLSRIKKKLEDNSGFYNYTLCEVETEYSVGDGNINNHYFNIGGFVDSSHPYVGKSDFVISGRMWNETDIDSKNIWVTQDFFVKSGVEYEVGDTLKFKKYDDSGTYFEVVDEYTICGILDSKNAVGYQMDNQLFISAKQANGKYINPKDISLPQSIEGMAIRSVKAVFKSDANLTYNISDYFERSNNVNSIKSIFKTDERIEVSSSLNDDMMGGLLMFALIAVACLFIAIIITLLSIGSAAQSIKISVEQNRKFIGMMKAIGMRDRNVLGMIKWQAVLMTIFAVTISIIGVIAMMPVINMLLTLMLPMVYGANAVISVSFNVLVPIFTILFLLAFILLFTRKSLRTISKMDVIAVISEVD